MSREIMAVRDPFIGRVVLEAWPEHGAWYERGKADQIGALYAPMLEDGRPDLRSGLVEIMVRYEDA